MQKPVNSEIDLIRAIYTRSNDLLLEAKAKKLTPKEPDLYSGVAVPAAPVAPAAPAAAPKTAKGKSKPADKDKTAVSEPTTDTTTERVNRLKNKEMLYLPNQRHQFLLLFLRCQLHLLVLLQIQLMWQHQCLQIPKI